MKADTMAARFELLLIGILCSVPVAIAQPSCAVSGRVLDDQGKPIPFAVVNDTVANQRGEYCIRALPPGEHFIRASARMQPPSASPACDSCCDPNSEFAATSYPVSVGKAGKASGLDIRMRRVPAYCVRGEVRDHTGRLRSDLAIGLEQGSWSAGVFNEAGRFLLTNLPSGSYTLVIRERPQLGRVLLRRAIHVGASNIVGLVIAVP